MMFGPEYIPAAYLEERLAAEKAKREAEEKRQQEQAAAASKAHNRPGQPTPSSPEPGLLAKTAGIAYRLLNCTGQYISGSREDGCWFSDAAEFAGFAGADALPGEDYG